MKKAIRSISLFLVTVIIAMVMPVYADTVIDNVLYTDIRTFINGTEITSYNIKGYTAVVVEDLAEYGFDVTWDGENRTLSVYRNTNKSVVGNEVSAVSGGKVGDPAMPVYATDIKTYFDGNYTESYNVGGRTIVYVDDLAKLYAEVNGYAWNSVDKTLSLTLSMGINEIIPLIPSTIEPTTPADPERSIPADPGYSTASGNYSTVGLNVVTAYDYYTFVLNIDSGVFHKAGNNCRAKNSMLEENKVYVNNTYDEVINAGFRPCGICW